jgi:diguanylate cyclase (GGDEF)-like protein
MHHRLIVSSILPIKTSGKSVSYEQGRNRQSSRPPHRQRKAGASGEHSDGLSDGSMRKLLAFLALAVSGAGASAPPAPAPLTSLRAVVALTNAQAAHRLPVNFDATVIYYRGYGKELFVQDGTAAIYVAYPKDLHLSAGDRIHVRGVTHESFRPYIDSSEVDLLGHRALPRPMRATYAQMLKGEADCRLVTVRAVIRSADLVPGNAPYTVMKVLVDGGNVDVDVASDDASKLNGLLDDEVEITGAASGRFDDKMEQTGILLHVQTMDGIRILKRPPADPWSLPITPMDRVVVGYRNLDQTQRMHVRGTLTYYQPGTAMVIENGDRSLWISTASYQPLQLGHLIDVTGFPSVHDGFLTLTRAEATDTLVPKPVLPAVFTWRELATGGNVSQGHGYDLVTIDGIVLAEVREAAQDGYVLSADGHLFSAIFNHPGGIWGSSSASTPPVKELPVGASVRVTGICMPAMSAPFTDTGEVAFDIYLRSPEDVSVVARPPWLNVRHLVYLAGLLMIALLVIGARALYSEHKSRRRNSALALIEQRRSAILEDVNASRPLTGILEKITELAAFTLENARCWCQLADGEWIGNPPSGPAASAQTVVEQAIVARNGVMLGKISTALRPRGLSEARAREALALAAELATLAIETSRLYSDLVHRSEFDLLTDAHNRFSLEGAIDALIRSAGSVFGIVYIDLNDFKQVNDRYGHRAGDIYLQQAAARMKRQIRPGDMLARLGGDEFAVLVSDVRNRGGVADIAMRLEYCFDDPFDLPTGQIRGSASIGVALYPDDGATRDSILSAADTAMYAAKNAHHKIARMLADQSSSAFAPQTSR